MIIDAFIFFPEISKPLDDFQFLMFRALRGLFFFVTWCLSGEKNLFLCGF
jgi:hypothetical protein